MKVAFQWPIKLKKKQAELPAFGERSEWIPYSSKLATDKRRQAWHNRALPEVIQRLSIANRA